MFGIISWGRCSRSAQRVGIRQFLFGFEAGCFEAKSQRNHRGIMIHRFGCAWDMTIVIDRKSERLSHLSVGCDFLSIKNRTAEMVAVTGRAIMAHGV
jgi:hypothetical protein